LNVAPVMLGDWRMLLSLESASSSSSVPGLILSQERTSGGSQRVLESLEVVLGAEERTDGEPGESLYQRLGL
jgi:hypothetical protein